MSGLNATAEALRSKHIKTLDALKNVLDENNRLKQRVLDLEAAYHSQPHSESVSAKGSDHLVKIVELEANVDLLTAKNAELRTIANKVQVLQERVTLLQDSKDRQKLKENQLSAQIASLQADKTKLEEQLRQGTNANAELNSQLKAAHEQTIEARRRYQEEEQSTIELTHQLAVARTSATNAARQIEEMQHLKANSSSPSSKNHLEEELLKLRQSNDALRAKLEICRRGAEDVADAKTVVDKKVKDLGEQVEFGRKELQRLQEIIEMQSQEQKRLEAALEEAHMSTASQQDIPLVELQQRSKFAAHVDGSRRLKEQNKQLLKRNALLKKQIEKLGGLVR